MRSSELSRHEAVQLRRYRDIFCVIKGRPILEVNLLKAGVLQAHRHIILSGDLDTPNDLEEEERERDAVMVAERIAQGDRDAVIVNLKIRNLLEYSKRITMKQDLKKTRRKISEPMIILRKGVSKVFQCDTTFVELNSKSNSSEKASPARRLTISGHERSGAVEGDEISQTKQLNEQIPQEHLMIEHREEEVTGIKQSAESEIDSTECLVDFPNRVLTEISDLSNINFLDSSDYLHSLDPQYSSSKTKIGYEYSPDFAAGRIFSDSLLNRYLWS